MYGKIALFSCFIFLGQEPNSQKTMCQTTCFCGRSVLVDFSSVCTCMFLDPPKKGPKQEKELEIKVACRSRVEFSNPPDIPKRPGLV